MKGRDQLLVSTLARHLPYRCSRGPGSALGEKGKKSASKASEEVVWGAEKVLAFPSTQTTAGLASLADIFPFRPRFLAFFPQCGAWSQAI